MKMSAAYQNRIIGLEWVPASSLRPHPKNFRDHPEEQRQALRGLFEEVGVAGAALVRDLGDGTYELIDGHCRTEELADQDVPVLVTDLTEEEADKLLAGHDGVTGMAVVNRDKLSALLKDVSFKNKAVSDMLAGMQKREVPTKGKVEPKGEPGKDSVGERFDVLVHCEDEDAQVRALDLLRQHGFERVRALVG